MMDFVFKMMMSSKMMKYQEHPEKMIDLSCRDDPKTQKGCATGFCRRGCPNKVSNSLRKR